MKNRIYLAYHGSSGFHRRTKKMLKQTSAQTMRVCSFETLTVIVLSSSWNYFDSTPGAMIACAYTFLLYYTFKNHNT
jgi:hypothetical protein